MSVPYHATRKLVYSVETKEEMPVFFVYNGKLNAFVIVGNDAIFIGELFMLDKVKFFRENGFLGLENLELKITSPGYLAIA